MDDGFPAASGGGTLSSDVLAPDGRGWAPLQAGTTVLQQGMLGNTSNVPFVTCHTGRGCDGRRRRFCMLVLFSFAAFFFGRSFLGCGHWWVLGLASKPSR